jgi:hypothetical protein
MHYHDHEDMRPVGAYEIQAWECTGPAFNGYVYSQAIALDMFARGCDIRMVWLPRTRLPGYGAWRKRVTTDNFSWHYVYGMESGS